MSVVLEFVRQTVPMGWKSTPSGWISGNCPMCIQNGENADTRSRGGFFFDEGTFQYNCFNCGFKTGWSNGRQVTGKLRSLLKTFGADESDIQRVNLELMREDELQSLHKRTTEKVETVKIDWKEVQLPPNAKSILDLVSIDSKIEEALQYLASRKLDTLANWYYSDFKHFADRIILPFYYKNVVVGYTARWIGDVPNKETPKYFLQQQKDYVFNLDAQHERHYVIVTEGQFDALVTGGVAIANNICSRRQADIIDSLNKEVIVCPDRDEPGQKLVQRAIERGWGVSFPPWEDCKDCVDAQQQYGRMFTVRSILDNVHTSPTKIRVLMKQYCR